MLNWLQTTVARMPAMTWWDVLDIAMVSVAIYEILKAIRGTRAVQMAVGSALLALMFYMPSSCSFKPTSGVRWPISAARPSSGTS